MLDFSMALDRQLILHHAFSVLNEVGLENLTLRRLAAKINVKAPALYWHFRDKRDLLDEMATQILRESTQNYSGLALITDWQEWAVACYQALRATLLRYRDGARVFSGAYLTDAELYAPMEANLSRVTAAGFSLRQTIVGLGALYSYTIGFVIEEQAAEFPPGTPNPQYDLAERDRRFDKNLYPLAAAAGVEIFSQRDARFTEGLAIIVTGMASLLSNGCSATS
jgi:TetR/AcrR family tetracycline transcriptional repressor